MALTFIGSSRGLNLTVKILSPEQKDAHKPGDSGRKIFQKVHELSSGSENLEWKL
jgi:ribosomal 50S subunit-associated protein YjgA (DUF615 family)